MSQDPGSWDKSLYTKFWEIFKAADEKMIFQKMKNHCLKIYPPPKVKGISLKTMILQNTVSVVFLICLKKSHPLLGVNVCFSNT